MHSPLMQVNAGFKVAIACLAETIEQRQWRGYLRCLRGAFVSSTGHHYVCLLPDTSDDVPDG